jgi:hypothetical protein
MVWHWTLQDDPKDTIIVINALYAHFCLVLADVAWPELRFKWKASAGCTTLLISHIYRDFRNVPDGTGDKTTDIAVALNKGPAVFQDAGCDGPPVDVIGVQSAIFHRESNFGCRFGLPERLRNILFVQLFLL